MTDRLADLRIDLRDLPGVTFAATAPDGRDGTRVQVAIDDPAGVPGVERAIEDLTRRHLDGPVQLDLVVAGVRRSELAIGAELRALPGVRTVELRRGPRGELLRAVITTSSPAATARVIDLLDLRLGSGFRRRRTELTEQTERQTTGKYRW